MVVKKFKCKGQYAKSRAQHVHDIVDYATGQQELDDKVLYTEFRNVQATEYEAAKGEMIELVEQAPDHSKNPMHHMMISFRSGEIPTIDQARECVQTMLKELGYQDCQHVFSVHQNTDHYHVHIAVNRVDPATKRVHWNFRDTDLMHKALAKIEHNQGWSREKNALFVQVGDDIVSTRNVEGLASVKLPEEARAVESRTGEQSAARLAAEKALPILLTRDSWDDVHRDLAAEGFEYRPKGGGAVLVAHIDGEQIQVKPSDLHKKAALKGMQDRLGPYQGADVEIVDRRPEPLPGVPREAFDAFQADKSQKVEKTSNIHAEHERMKMELQKERKAVLQAINDTDWTGRGAALAALQKVASEDHKAKLESLTERYKEKIASNKQVMDKVSDLETWVAMNCPQYSEKVKYSIEKASTRVELKIDEPLTGELAAKHKAFLQYAQAVGADRFRITSRGEKGGKPIAYVFGRDPVTKVADGFEARDVHKHLNHMLRFANQGEHLYFTPLSDKMHHILVDDLTRERLMQMRKDGFNPSVVIESSPGSFQAIVNVPKLGMDAERDRQIANKISEGLNKTYGDVNLSGAIHPHRAPEFPNPKQKHIDEKGASPLAKVEAANGGQCDKLTAFSLYMNEHLDYIAFQAQSGRKNQVNQAKEAQEKAAREDREKNQAMEQGQKDQHAQQVGRQSDLVRLYKAHRAAALHHANLNEAEANMSRVDAMVAVRLRGTGHNQAQVAAILAAGAPEGRGDTHKWPDYAQKTAEHAFSAENTRKLDKEFRRFKKQWKQIEHKALNTDVATHVKEDVRKEQIRQQEQKQKEKGKRHGPAARGAVKQITKPVETSRVPGYGPSPR